MMCDWRVKLTNVNSGSDKYSCWFGLHNATAALEPTSGFYFRYTPGDTSCSQLARKEAPRTP